MSCFKAAPGGWNPCYSPNLTVTAEGVESKEQVAFLKEQNCQEAQGYYFSRPVTPEKFVELFLGAKAG